MTTPTNGTGNLIDELEESFLSLVQILAKDEDNYNSLDKDDTRVDIEQSTQKFVDVARQVESFFLQKRFVLSALKPELILREEINELKVELQRKDELIKRHYDKISYWQSILNDVRSQPSSSTSPSSVVATSSIPINSSNTSATSVGSSSSGVTPSPSMINVLQQQIQQQQLQQQLQRQMSVNIPGNSSATGGAISSMLSPQQTMFMQQQGLGQRSSPFPSQTPGNMLGPGPLAYLEKTTSNIGMPDGRR